MRVHGLPSTFQFTVRDLLLLHNVPFEGTRLDWDALTQAGTVTGLEDVDSNIVISVEGYLEFNLSGFVLAAGGFSIAQTLETDADGKAINDGTLPFFDASVLTITLENVFLFAGVNGAFAYDGSNQVTGFADPVPNDMVGIGFSDVNLVIAIVGEIPPEDPLDPPARSWTGISATLSSLETFGLPSDFDIGGKDFIFRYNLAAKDAAESKLDWKNISQFDETLLEDLTNTTELSVAGFLTISIKEFVYISGAVALERRELQVKTADSEGTQTVSALAIGAKDIKAFVGVGGPYWVDSNDDSIIDENDEPLTDGAMGVTLEVDELALVLM